MSKVAIAVVGGCAVIWGLLTISSTASADPSIPRAAAAADARISAGPEADDLGSGTEANESRRWELFDVAARSDVARATRRNERNPSVLPVVEHVVYISLDGFNPQAITTLGPARAPAFHRMISQGASTLNARTIVEQTRTLPNHSSMVSGRKLATPGGHGVPFNQDNGSIIHASAGHYVASIFDVVHDNGGTTGMYVGKAKFDFLDRSWNATNGAPDLTGVDNGRDKIDVYQMANSSTTVTALLYQLASSTPMTLSFVHLADTDNAGHAFGFMSAAYLDAVTVVDGYLDQILDAIAADPDLARSTAVIVTTDHGGASGVFDHADPSVAANYTVPFLAWGEDVAAGADLYALNPDRANPGTDQPPYSATVPPIRTGEAANLIAELLRYGPVPGTTFNSDQSLDLAWPGVGRSVRWLGVR